MSSTTEYAALMLFDPLGSDGDMTGSTFVENLAGATSTSNMQIIDAFLKQKASFIVKTSAEWAVNTTVLRANDFGGASDTGEVRRGDGVHTWEELSTFDPGNVSGKIDKVPSATNGNLASFTADGSVADSGKKAADFAMENHTHGSITNDGKIGTVADQVVVTGTDGMLSTKSAADMRTLLDVPKSATKQDKITISGIVKGDGSGALSAAQTGVDYAAPAISTTATLTVAGWSDKSQTVSVTGVTTTNNILVMPQKASSEDYYTAGVEAIVQATDSLTFACETVPTVALIVDIIILG